MLALLASVARGRVSSGRLARLGPSRLGSGCLGSLGPSVLSSGFLGSARSGCLGSARSGCHTQLSSGCLDLARAVTARHAPSRLRASVTAQPNSRTTAALLSRPLRPRPAPLVMHDDHAILQHLRRKRRRPRPPQQRRIALVDPKTGRQQRRAQPGQKPLRLSDAKSTDEVLEVAVHRACTPTVIVAELEPDRHHLAHRRRPLRRLDQPRHRQRQITRRIPIDHLEAHPRRPLRR